MALPSKTIAYGHGIYAVDSGYVRPLLAAIHLIVEDERVALVDTGTNQSLPAVLAALKQLGLSPDAVDYVIATHVHLDHRRRRWAMMRAFAKARLVVHPRGAPHMIDPSALVKGAAAVYGADELHRLYGEILPVDAARVIEATHASTLSLAGRELLFLDTPGHARHHICIVDRGSGDVFTWRQLRTFLPRTRYRRSTVRFSDDDADPVRPAGDARFARSDHEFSTAARLFDAFGQLCDLDEKADQLHRLIDAQVAIVRRESGVGDESTRHARLRAALTELLLGETHRFGCRLADAVIVDLFAADLELNAQGLAFWIDNAK